HRTAGRRARADDRARLHGVARLAHLLDREPLVPQRVGRRGRVLARDVRDLDLLLARRDEQLDDRALVDLAAGRGVGAGHLAGVDAVAVLLLDRVVEPGVAQLGLGVVER